MYLACVTAGDVLFPAVRTTLANEAGFHCANPYCRQLTSGPSDSSATGTTNIGVGAHITGARLKGPRYDATMAPAVRASAANGIWLCQDHAHMVDVDMVRYTVQLLHGWKRRAQVWARSQIEGQRHLERSSGLIRHRARFDTPNDTEAWRRLSASFLQDVGAGQLWSSQKQDLVRMLIYELGLNAISHGDAQWLSLRARGHRIELRHLGPAFSPRRLLSTDSPRGGTRTLQEAEGRYRDSLVISYTHNGTVATTTIADVTFGGPAGNPCGLAESTWLAMSPAERSATHPNYAELHIYFRENWGYSDGYKLKESVGLMAEIRTLVLHGVTPHPHNLKFVQDELPMARLADDPAESQPLGAETAP